MLPLAALMLAAQAIPTVMNLGKAVSQGVQAKKLAKTDRPGYEIPEAVKQQVNQSRYLASMREMPGQNLMENRIGANIGKGVSELKNVSSNASDLASNVAKMYSSGNESINDIGIRAGQQWLNNQGLLNQNLGQLGQYQDQQFNINKMQPYQNNMAASSALREGAFRNLSAAGQNIASGISGAANVKYQQDIMNKLLGNKKKVGGQAGMDMLGEMMNTGSITGNTQKSPSMSLTEASQSPMVNPQDNGIDTQSLIEQLFLFNKNKAGNQSFNNPSIQ